MLARIFLEAADRMTLLRFLLPVLLFASAARAATLPGFRLEEVAHAAGFVSSVVTDSQGTIYFSTTDGWIYRVEGTAGSEATKVASVPTKAGGNGGLLGIVLLDDDTAVAHYTLWNNETGEFAKVLEDVISRIDLRTGAETVLKRFVCNLDNYGLGASSEHHGGNPTLGPDGTVFVGIGEYGGHVIAQDPRWNGGKIWRVDTTTGDASQWAIGMRNPYDLAWDPELQRVVVVDNGPTAGDEVHVLAQESNAGWPVTFGNQPPMDGASAPQYVWPQTVAPTGFVRLTGTNPMLRRGYLAGAFVTRGIYYFPSISESAAAEPIAIVKQLQEFVIDVTQTAGGEIYVATAGMNGTAIWRLHVPLRGDCNGDGFADWRDVYPLLREIGDDEDGSHPMITAQDGAHAGSWGCDANADSVIDAADIETLREIVGGRRRAVRAR